MKTEFYYGMSSFSSEPIHFDRRKNKLPNGMVFGQAGAGKTFMAKNEICQVIGKTADPIIIIDEGGEYSNLATEVNPFDEKSEYHINPLDVYIGNNTFCNREEIIPYYVTLAMFEEIIGRPLNAYESNVVERSCNAVFEPFTEHLKEHLRTDGKHCDYASNPTLKDVADAAPELRLIEKFNSVYMYIDRYFSYKTNMPDDRAIQLAWRKVPLPHKITKAAYTACLHYVWNRLVQHHDNMSNAKEYEHLWVYLENADVAFHSVTKGLTNSLMNLYCRSNRQYGGIVTLIAQDYTDILNSEQGRACINNTEFLRFLNINQNNRENIRKMYGLSDDMLESIYDVSYGYGLLCINSNWISFELRNEINEHLPDKTKS